MVKLGTRNEGTGNRNENGNGKRNCPNRNGNVTKETDLVTLSNLSFNWSMHIIGLTRFSYDAAQVHKEMEQKVIADCRNRCQTQDLDE